MTPFLICRHSLELGAALYPGLELLSLLYLGEEEDRKGRLEVEVGGQRLVPVFSITKESKEFFRVGGQGKEFTDQGPRGGSRSPGEELEEECY